jgi:hypothetical protein
MQQINNYEFVALQTEEIDYKSGLWFSVVVTILPSKSNIGYADIQWTQKLQWGQQRPLTRRWPYDKYLGVGRHREDW